MTAPTKAALAKHTIEIASGFRGVSRHSNPAQVTRFLNLWGLDFADDNGKPYPFCAAGLGYASVKAYCDLAGVKYDAATALRVFRGQLHTVEAYWPIGTSCEDIHHRATARGIYLPIRQVNSNTVIQPGWQALFEFDRHRPGQASHIGLVTDDHDDDFGDVEFNTSGPTPGSEFNGGFVWSKHRNYSAVLGFVKTY